MKNSLLATAIVSTLLLGGCSSTDTNHLQNTAKVEGKKLETDAKVEGKKLEKSVDEGMNSTKIKAALTASSKLDASHITVSTEAKDVHLRGSVPTAEQKQLANRIATDTVGKSQTVVDELKVEAHPSDDKSPSPSPSGTATP